MPNIYNGVTATSAIIPEIWSRTFYDQLLNYHVFEPMMDKSYQGDISAVGDKVNISTVGQFTEATVMTSDTDAVDAEAINITSQQLVIDKQIVKDFIISDRAQIQSLPFVEKLKELAIDSINKKIESILITLSVPAVANALAYDNVTLKIADILAAKEKLDGYNCPMSNRYMVMNSVQMNSLLEVTEFLSSDFHTSGSPVITGQLPNALFGFSPRFTNMVGNTTYFMHSSYATMAVQKGMDVKEFDLGVEGRRGVRVNSTVLMGAKLLDDKRLVTVA